MQSPPPSKGKPSRFRNDRPVEVTKKIILDAIRDGHTVARAVEIAGRTIKTYESYRKNDPDFAAAADRIRVDKKYTYEVERDSGEFPTFAEFSEKYLGARVFPHMQNVIDLLEGREPSWSHPSMVFERGEPDLTIVNMPPEHPAVFSTPLFTTTRGWITLGEVTPDDMIVGREGFPCPVGEVWESPGPVPVWDVHFSTGDVVRTSGEHLWNVFPVFAGSRRRHEYVQMSTAALAADPGRWRIPVADGWDGPDAVLPVDPYLFGYWLGDGCHSKSEFAVGDEDLAEFTGQLDMLGMSHRVSRDSRGRSNVVYVHGLRGPLRATGMFGDIDRGIPAPYFTGSFKQRLALLQGLMDADGTITAKDSRARFVQHKERLSLDVYRLVASLGLKPHRKRYGDAWEVGFRTGGDPVFRLPRKAARQRPLSGTSKASSRVITSVTPAGEEPVRCISVLTDTNEYCIGDGMILTRNGKSTTLTMNYLTYRIHKDPNIRILIVSKTQTMAAKFLYGIKTRLTHPKYRDMHAKYGPPNGWDAGSESWTQNMIYVSGDSRDSGEKDPTVQALGIRGHIYGARADIILLDDCVDGTNAHEYEKQIDWVQGEVISRISASGMLGVIGTRLAAKDLYLELRKPDRYPDEESPWTYLSMPAVLEFADEPKDWVTLWPRSNSPEIGAKGEMAEADADGLYPKWDGPRLFKKRARMQPRTWAMLYMQQQVNEDAVFPPDLVGATVNGNRLAGLIPRGMANVRPNGMDGLVVVAGLDPAMAGHTAAVVIGLDHSTQKRYVLDVHNQAGMTPDGIRDLIRSWTSKYNVAEWRVEKNAFQSMLTQDREVREYLAACGSMLREHHTGANKWQADFGVASMTTLFAGAKDKRALIELPSTHRSEGTKALIEQLVTWHPEVPKGHKTDCVMALWFTELACRDRIQAVSNYGRSHARNAFATRYDRRQQRVVNLQDLEMSGWAG